MKKNSIYFFATILLIFSVLSPVDSQMHISPGPDCITSKDNEGLRKLSTMKQEDILEGDFKFQHPDGILKYGRWVDGLGLATSHLRPKGKALSDFMKSKPSGQNETKMQEWTRKSCEYNAYDGLYEQHNKTYCTDKNRGVGEIILSYIVIKDSMGKINYLYILPGKQTSKKDYFSYSRPKDVTIYYLVPLRYGTSLDVDMGFTDPGLYQKQKVTLKDEVGYQKINIQNFDQMYGDIYETSSGSKVVYIMIGIEINSIYDGSIHKDITCIGDIGNDNKDSVFQYLPK
ncbi:hypothetical protein LEP1GSC047_0081 [Leptospira inadai serovar Lyme str. 10]|uniref:MORN repeat protein n=2 Tax=Leptospira inadai serovar Lyme TaxID=293084 RepID=V6HF20_9LEPT|nr:hypothetical protein [Leptospira inadai]EQA38817.1 hypothetical protein LEP1GSC047_0081 [Leptospira inadai serovar Lyme str. 10]PNV75083.1 hypothetical protein BES34_011045 [Leptospira inadai serovar Lyme]